MANISAAQQAEINRKAAAGIKLTNPTAATQAAYNAAKATASAAKPAPVNNGPTSSLATPKPPVYTPAPAPKPAYTPAPSVSAAQQAEIARKAQAGIPLTNATSQTQAIYNQLKAAPAPVKPVQMPTYTPAVKPVTMPSPVTPAVKPVQLPSPVVGPPPVLGYGGAATSQQVADNAKRLAADTAYKQSEIDRTKAVIAARKAQGLSTTEQERYLSSNLGDGTLGYGGVTYGTSAKANATIAANKALVGTDAGKQSEIDRTLAVIKARQDQGLSTADQERYLSNNLGYTAPAPVTAPVETPLPELPPMPELPTYNPGPSPAQQGNTYDPSQFKDDMTKLIQEQTDAAYAAQLQKLQALRDTQLQGLQGQQTQSDQAAVAASNKASAANAIAAQRLKERMANMGLMDSGYNIENISDLNAQRQDALGSIEQQRANNLQDIEGQRTQIRNAAASGDLALLQELQAKEADQMIQLGYTVDSRQFQERQFQWQKLIDEAGMTGNYGGGRTLAAQAQDWGKKVDVANLTGQWDGQSTMAGKQANWNAAKDVWDASGHMVNPASDWTGLLRQVVSGKAPLTQNAQQVQLANMWQTAQQTGFISDTLAGITGLPKGTTTLDAQRFLLQQDQSAQGWAGLDVKSSAASGKSNNTLYTAAQMTGNIQDSLTVSTGGGYDPTTGQNLPVTKTFSKDPAQRYEVYKQAIMSGQGFTDTQLNGILAASGFTAQELRAYEAQLSKEYNLGG